MARSRAASGVRRLTLTALVCASGESIAIGLPSTSNSAVKSSAAGWLFSLPGVSFGSRGKFSLPGLLPTTAAKLAFAGRPYARRRSL